MRDERGKLDEAEPLLKRVVHVRGIESGKLDEAEPLQRRVSTILLSPYKDVPRLNLQFADLMKRSPFRDVPWLSVDLADVMKRNPYKDVPGIDLMKRSPYKDVPFIDLMKRSPYKDVPWQSQHCKLRKTLTRAPAAVVVGEKAESLEAGLGRRRRQGVGGSGGGGGGPGGRTYVPCHSLKRSRRGSWGNGPVVSQVQWRNAVEILKRVGSGGKV